MGLHCYAPIELIDGLYDTVHRSELIDGLYDTVHRSVQWVHSNSPVKVLENRFGKDPPQVDLCPQPVEDMVQAFLLLCAGGAVEIYSSCWQ